MSEPDPQTWTAAPSDPDNMNAEIQAPFQWVLGHSANPFPHLRWRGSSNSTLANGSTWTAIDFDTADIQRGWPTPGEIPIDGTYDLGCAVDVDFAISNKAVRIRLNGATTLGEDDQPGAALLVPGRITCNVGCVPLSAGDVITVECFNDAVGTVECIAGAWAPVLWIEYIATAN